MKKWTVDATALLLRVSAGLIFLPHGYSKVFGAGGAAAFASDLPSYGIPAFLGYAAAYAEFFGAILLIAGLLTRIDAFLLACTMFVATFVVQLPDALRDPQAASNRFFGAMRTIELPLGLLAMTLALAFIGGGRFSLDHLFGIEERFGMLRRKKRTAAEAAALESVN
jgi:putative oxidoreductase